MAFINKYIKQKLNHVIAIQESHRLIELKRIADKSALEVMQRDIELTGEISSDSVTDLATLNAERLYAAQRKIEKERK